MNKTQLHSELHGMLKTLGEQHEHLSAHKDIIPQIEVDLFLQNVRKMYEFGLMLHHRNAMYCLDDLEVKMMEKLQAERKTLDEKLQALRVDELKKATSKIKSEEIRMDHVMELIADEQPTIAEKGILQNENQTTTDAEFIEPQIKTIEIKKDKPVDYSYKDHGQVNTQYDDKPTLGDSFNDAKSLADKMAIKFDKMSVAEKMKHKPIADLKAGIGINEKFLFIQQLFNGNVQHYNESIEKINIQINSSAAFEFIQINIATTFSWDDKQKTVQTLYELVHRRFLK